MAFSVSQTLNLSPQWLCFQQIVKHNSRELHKKRAKASINWFGVDTLSCKDVGKWL